ncbi:MAG TPA: HAMP domain-containing sensor histidine kinase [Granulicella sp.]|jgi:two-component system sensor histidine kinase SenX3|nr:HAMP domain-containing sensor histidine kinase [Granulicella sp.]
MNITRRRGAIATFITMGVLLVGVAVTLNIAWILQHGRNLALAVLGIILFALLIAGVVLNTVFLVREVRRNERQDSFLNAVTHELKTPIASIRLYLETLERRPIEETQRREFYRIMLSDTDRLLATVEQVLKAGEQGHKRKDENRRLLDMEKLVAECVAVALERRHLAADTIVLAPVPGGVRLRVMGNAEDLRTAVTNLLDNAVKYSPGGVRVRCRLGIAHYTWVSLTVEDTGVGIPTKQLKRVFHRFYRVPGRSMMAIKGTGLGLFIVRSIARQHGGEVTASSPGPGLGTTLTLRLPLANPEATARMAR